MSGELLLAALEPSTPPSQLREIFQSRPDLGQLLAQNPSTPIDLLERLAKSPDSAVVAPVAQNPSTPLPLLFSLGQRFPQRLLRNPIWPLLLLENPNLYAEIPLQTLLGLLTLDGVPDYFLERAVTHAESAVRLAVAQNAMTSAALLEQLTHDQAVSVRRAVSLHGNASATTLSLLSLDSEPDVRQAVAKNPRATPEALLRLIGDPSPRVRGSAAQNPNAPQEGLSLLRRAGASTDLAGLYGPVDLQLSEKELSQLAEGGPKARELAARHPSAAARLLARLSLDKEPDVRRAVARHLRTPQAALAALSRDLDGDTRWFVAQNPHTTREVLLRLVEEVRIQWEIAAKPDADAALLAQLGQSEDRFVRARLARNPKTPVLVLQALAKDDDPVVREGLAQNPSALGLLSSQEGAPKTNTLPNTPGGSSPPRSHGPPYRGPIRDIPDGFPPSATPQPE